VERTAHRQKEEMTTEVFEFLSLPEAHSVDSCAWHLQKFDICVIQIYSAQIETK